MKKFLIVYELNSKEKNYAPLFEIIKGFGHWWHYLETAWIIKSDHLTAHEISEKVRPYIDEIADNFVVIEINDSNRQGWLPKKAWEWLNS